MTRQRKPGQQDQNFQSKVEQYWAYLRFSLDGGFAVFPQVEKYFHITKYIQMSNWAQRVVLKDNYYFKVLDFGVKYLQK